MSNPERLKTTKEPHAPVDPLGAGKLHGPPRDKHIVVVLGLDKLARERLKRDGESPSDDTPLSRAFSCDMLQQQTIHQSIADIQATWPDRFIGTCAYNGSIRKRGEFLKVTMEQLKDSIEASVFAFFTFAQLTLRKMEEHGQGGSLLVTGATSSIRGREGFSIAREYGPKNVHVAHVIVDGLIESKTALAFFGKPTDERFLDGNVLVTDQMAKSWLFLAQQHPSTWTLELDLRPANEKF
ncbi:uncharacterized protein MJAP1_000714 [Malassezia japonica]|uniref:Uncharacterized protein n=1 Tax=Malassezia japonica TaxID=223818 RepID=A0AAF0J8L5_9BASI|nr:uncharacterized protein MJAP1_000714 [Malassezia japonica]WFD37767.1 hypothetical protein MJAP1_000714 [Malassezia japonica]